MSFPSFGDIDKTIKDLLSKDFFNAKKAPYIFKAKTSGPYNSKVTTALDISASASMTPTLTVESSNGSGFSLDKLEMSGKTGTIKTETSLVGGGLPAGLKLEFKGDSKSAGELGATYETDAVTAEVALDVVDVKSASVNVCSGTGNTTFGGSVNLNLEGDKSPALADYSVGVAHAVPGTCSGAAVLSNKLSQATVTFGYDALADINLGAQLSWPSNALSFGGSYSCCKNTSMKVKADTDGVIAASVKQTLAPKTVVVGMLSLDSNQTPSVGGSITIG
jgi:hypothetical protein